MRTTISVVVFLATVGCGSHKSSAPDPAPDPAPATAPAPVAATPPAAAVGSAAPAPAGLELSNLADLDDAGLAILHLRLAFMGAPVGPQTKRWAYRIDAESFEKSGPGADGKPTTLGARKTGQSLRPIVEAMRRHGLAARPAAPDPGCAGGSTYTLEVTRGAEASTLRAYLCGGTTRGTLAGDIEAFAADLEWLLPDATRRLPRP